MSLYSKIKYIMFATALLLLSACSSGGSGEAEDTGSSDWGSMNWDSDSWS